MLTDKTPHNYNYVTLQNTEAPDSVVYTLTFAVIKHFDPNLHFLERLLATAYSSFL
jgi:hypothetical protein